MTHAIAKTKSVLSGNNLYESLSPLLVFIDDEHRDVCRTQDPFGDASEQRLVDARAAVAAHADEVDVLVVGVAGDDVVGGADPDLLVDGHVAVGRSVGDGAGSVVGRRFACSSGMVGFVSLPHRAPLFANRFIRTVGRRDPVVPNSLSRR